MWKVVLPFYVLGYLEIALLSANENRGIISCISFDEKLVDKQVVI